MIRRSVSALALAAATFLPVASHAFPLFHSGANGNNAVAAAQPKGKMVKMTLKNRTDVPMALTIGGQPVTIAANGEYALKAVEGTQVLGADNMVKVTVSRDLDGTTCSFR